MAATILSHQASTGFYKAPVCKGILSTVFLTCTAAHVPVISSYLRTCLSCELPSILTSPQIWRIAVNRLTFTHSKDFLCSALLLYYFRIFEKRMGSTKFASHLLGTSILATLIEIIALLYFSQHFSNPDNSGKLFLPPGLYSLIFPLFVNYFLDVPQVTVTKFIGLPVTGKTLTYLLGIQIACSSTHSFIASACGLLSGVLYRRNFLYLQDWMIIPSGLANTCHKLFGWLLVSREPSVGQTGATLELQRQEQAERWEQQYIFNRAQDFRRRHSHGQGYVDRLVDNENGVEPRQQAPLERGGNESRAGFLANLFPQRRERPELGRPTDEPSSENIETLVQMGFDRARSVEALRDAGNDLSIATNILLRQ